MFCLGYELAHHGSRDVTAEALKGIMMDKSASGYNAAAASPTADQRATIDISLINDAGAQVGKQILTFTTRFAADVGAAMVKANEKA